MVVIDSKDLIVKYELLSEDEKADFMLYFAKHDKKGIIELAHHRYSTYEQMRKGLEPCDIRVTYSPDMFLYGRQIIAEVGYAIAADSEGNAVCTLKWEHTGYQHSYAYTGGADMWFLNEYDCLFLHGCNEYSMELCLGALNLWKGNRLVLVGDNWEGLIPQLPDIQGVECFFQEVLTEESLLLLSKGKKNLHVVIGMPHEEQMERYEKGIMFYDEVMSFTYMFSDLRELGPENPDKQFLILDGLYETLGLYAIFSKSEVVARYVKSRGYIPIITVKRKSGSFYQDMPGDDAWGKFYNQPEKYTLEEVMRSKNVCFAPIFYNGSIQSNIMNRVAGQTKLSWPSGIYNDAVWAYIREREQKFLPSPERTLGVLARGTDYAKSKFHNHAIHATKEVIADMIDKVWNEWGEFDYIYVATEDKAYCEYFKERYGDNVMFTDQERFTVDQGEKLSDIHWNRESGRNGFLLGVDYILSIYLLSKCKALIASGSCAGLGEALKENAGRYEHTYVFRLGVND